MKLEKWFTQKLDEFKGDVEFRTEEVILEITERVVELMKKENINRTELAKRLGVSKPFISKLLNGNPNMRLKTMVSLSMALKYDLNISFDRRVSMSLNVAATPLHALPHVGWSASSSTTPATLSQEGNNAVICSANEPLSLAA